MYTLVEKKGMQPSEQPTVIHKWNLTKVIKTPNTRRTAALQNSIKLKQHNFYKAGWKTCFYFRWNRIPLSGGFK